ncbi:MAG: DUF1330 domain-containing protein [Paracoccaceae bacterium]|nr:DUF1330 domain-containing protein [Paracoccaceae bacterium]
MSEATTLVVTAVPNPAEMGAVQAYLQGVMPLFKGAGGKPVKRLKVDEVLNGRPSAMVLVMDFESSDAVAELFASEDYKALVPMRDQGFQEMNIAVGREM